MKALGDISPDITTLTPCDYQAFFEALDARSSPTEALRIAFLRQKKSFGDPDANTPSAD